MTPLARLAGHRVDPLGLDGVLLHAAKRRLVDAMGCALAGLEAAPARAARQVAMRAPLATGARLLGTDLCTLPELAAFANGAAVRCLEGNDVFAGGGGHPSDSIPALLAVAETAGAGGRDVLAAIVLAYDVHHCLFRALDLRATGLDHSLCNAAATAAGAAALLGLGEAETAHALSLAVTSGLPLGVARRGALSMWKSLAGPHGAHNGVLAAMMAQSGVTAPADPFAEADGLWQLLGRLEIGPVRSDVPAVLLADDKALLAEYHAQGPILAALRLRAAIGSPEAIAAVRIETYRFAFDEIGSGAEKWRPQTREAADHSLPFSVAGVLVDGAFSADLFAEARLSDPRILRLIDRVEVVENPAFTAASPAAFPCRVEIRLGDGRVLAEDSPNPPGHHATPLSDAALEDKFRLLAGRTLPADQVDALLARLGAFEHEPAVTGLF